MTTLQANPSPVLASFLKVPPSKARRASSTARRRFQCNRTYIIRHVKSDREEGAWERARARIGSGLGSGRDLPIEAPMRTTATGLTALALASTLGLAGCVVHTGWASYGAASKPSWTGYVPDLPVSEPPYDDVHASWKQRIDQPYVFIEHIGSYADTGALIPVLQREVLAQGLEPSGPPFALFFDDPGRVVPERLRSRACLPIGGKRSPVAPLQYEVLPSTTVVYAVIGGPYPDVPRAYPGVYAFLERQGWVESGPLREIYLVPPSSVEDWDELMTEVQIPASAPD